MSSKDNVIDLLTKSTTEEYNIQLYFRLGTIEHNRKQERYIKIIYNNYHIWKSIG